MTSPEPEGAPKPETLEKAREEQCPCVPRCSDLSAAWRASEAAVESLTKERDEAIEDRKLHDSLARRACADAIDLSAKLKTARAEATKAEELLTRLWEAHTECEGGHDHGGPDGREGCIECNVSDYFTSSPTPPISPQENRMKSADWNPLETLFAFMCWLTSRDEETHLSAHHEASSAVELIKQFAQRHELADVRDGWDKAIVPESKPTSPPTEDPRWPLGTCDSSELPHTQDACRGTEAGPLPRAPASREGVKQGMLIYSCPRGHLYAIAGYGEDLVAMERGGKPRVGDPSQCPKCKANPTPGPTEAVPHGFVAGPRSEKQ